MRAEDQLRTKGRISRPKARGSRQPNRRVGLARALSKLGYCSRSQAAELIRAGRVRLNGTTRRDPEAPVTMGPDWIPDRIPDRIEERIEDRIEVDGRAVASVARAYWMMNKPRGIVTTAADEKGRETVYSYLPENVPWLAPVGRLDKASEGLLLLTNDSEWAARIAAPESHVEKTYHVQIEAVADATITRKLQAGVRVAGGEILRARRVEILRYGEKNSWLSIVLDEGRNRQIRRMFEALGIEVLRLIRVAIGPLQLGDLPKGKCRVLTRDEIGALESG